MTLDLSVFDWKLLRSLVRAGATPLTGRELRHTPTRFTKTGEFLGKLVDRGLIAVHTPDPDPFAAGYALTPLGRHAAEYGEYDARMPWEKPSAAGSGKPAGVKAAAKRAKK